MSNRMESVIEWFGSQSECARQLGVNRAAVSQWMAEGGFPAARALQIESMSNGAFRAIDISNLEIEQQNQRDNDGQESLS
jgi:DNA-binding transcriptional regulator YdaS (Cro superfamily)